MARHRHRQSRHLARHLRQSYPLAVARTDQNGVIHDSSRRTVVELCNVVVVRHPRRRFLRPRSYPHLKHINKLSIRSRRQIPLYHLLHTSFITILTFSRSALSSSVPTSLTDVPMTSAISASLIGSIRRTFYCFPGWTSNVGRFVTFLAYYHVKFDNFSITDTAYSLSRIVLHDGWLWRLLTRSEIWNSIQIHSSLL